MPVMDARSYFTGIIESHRQGAAEGICSVNSSESLVLRAVVRQSLSGTMPLLVEHGENSQSPAEFAVNVEKLTQAEDFPVERLMLGGGRLHSCIRQRISRADFIQKTRQYVEECIRAGFGKIYLDADAAGDGADVREVAQTLAALCLSAEGATANENKSFSKPCYVIGMPPSISSVEKVSEIWQAASAAFATAGLDDAWQRVVALAVQPEIGFSDNHVVEYKTASCTDLRAFSEKDGSFVYQVPVADYQSGQALRRMVADHFAILCISPVLTFAMREALFSLAMIENEWMIGKPGARLSNLIVELDKAMQLKPQHWKDYYTTGNGFDQMLARKYSYKDRSRMYWQVKDVQSALDQLFKNLSQNPPPLSLLKQFMPDLYWPLREGRLENDPEALVIDRIQQAYKPYTDACYQTGD